MAAHELSVEDARRIAVGAQLLDRERPADMVEMVRHLTLLQIDPTAAIAPSADLVAWSRLGSSYSPDDLVDALKQRKLIELQATIRPAEDIALYRAEMLAVRDREPTVDWQRRYRAWMEANDAFRRDILARLEADAPLPSSDLPDTCAVPWKSTGWTNEQNVIRMLEAMAGRGEVAVAGRVGRMRLWDLAERVYPDDPAPPMDEALRRRDERRLQALGIARARSPKVPVEPHHVGSVGEPARVEGIKGQWQVDPAQLGQPLAPRAALLSPFDRLVHDRRRLLELFGFEYGLEMYKPKTARRWGYYALPILYAERLVGKLDAAVDRDAGVLRVYAIHEDEAFDAAIQSAVDDEIAALATWLSADVVR